MVMLTHTDILMREAKKYVADKLGNDWSIDWDRAKGRWGYCQYGKKLITISRPLIELNPDDFWDTIYHEVAHGLCGHKIGHGYKWRLVCIQLGGNPESSHSAVNDIESKYIGTCPNGHTAERERLTKNALRASCSKCSPKWNDNYLFTWAERKVNA